MKSAHAWSPKAREWRSTAASSAPRESSTLMTAARRPGALEEPALDGEVLSIVP